MWLRGTRHPYWLDAAPCFAVKKVEFWAVVVRHHNNKATTATYLLACVCVRRQFNEACCCYRCFVVACRQTGAVSGVRHEQVAFDRPPLLAAFRLPPSAAAAAIDNLCRLNGAVWLRAKLALASLCFASGRAEISFVVATKAKAKAAFGAQQKLLGTFAASRSTRWLVDAARQANRIRRASELAAARSQGVSHL